MLSVKLLTLFLLIGCAFGDGRFGNGPTRRPSFRDRNPSTGIAGVQRPARSYSGSGLSPSPSLTSSPSRSRPAYQPSPPFGSRPPLTQSKSFNKESDDPYSSSTSSQYGSGIDADFGVSAVPAGSKIDSLGKEITELPLDQIKSSLTLLENIYQKLKTEKSSVADIYSDGTNLKLEIGAPGSPTRQRYAQQAEKYLNNTRKDSNEILSALPGAIDNSSLGSAPASGGCSGGCSPAILDGDMMRRIKSDGTLGELEPLTPAMRRYKAEQDAKRQAGIDPHEHDLDSEKESCILYNGKMYCPGHPDYERIKKEYAKSQGHKHTDDDSEGNSCFMHKGKMYCPGHPDYERLKKELANSKSAAPDFDDPNNQVSFEVNGKTISPGDLEYEKIKSQYQKAKAAGREDEFLNPNGTAGFMHNGEMIFPGHEKYDELKAELDEAKAAAPDHDFNTPTSYFTMGDRKIFPGNPLYEILKKQHEQAAASGNKTNQLEGYMVDGEMVFPGNPKYEATKAKMDKMKSKAPDYDFNKDAPGTQYFMLGDKMIVPGDPMYDILKQQKEEEELGSPKEEDPLEKQMKSIFSNNSANKSAPRRGSPQTYGSAPKPPSRYNGNLARSRNGW